MRTYGGKRALIAVAGLAALGVLASSRAPAQVALDEEFGKEPSWKAPSLVEVRSQVFAWLDQRKPDEALRKQTEALWPKEEVNRDAPPSDVAQPVDVAMPADAAKPIDAAQLLQRVISTIALIDAPSRQLAELCAKPRDPAGKLPDIAWLADEKTSPLVRNNLRLWLGKWLSQERLYDDALAQLSNLQPADVIDPASLLFYQSVCHHWMLQKNDGLKSIAQLLERRKAIPRRYLQVAELMQADLNDLEDESLDHISRRMNDVTRRLDFGHAGKKVRGVEDGIIASLDKLIKEQEDRANAMQQRMQRQRGQQNQKGQQDGQRDGRGNRGDPQGDRSTNPAEDSRLARGRGAGQVQSKNIGSRSGWGDLPPKEREEAMQQISKEFPSHYRDIIEQYFRKLASEDEEK